MIPLLLDENLDRSLQKALLHRNPALKVLRVSDTGAPPSGMKDPQLLQWLETQGYFLVSNDRNSLQAHLNEHLSNGGHIPGILWLKSSAPYDQVTEHLEIISLALDLTHNFEFADCIRMIPLA